MANVCRELRRQISWITKKDAYVFLSLFLWAFLVATLINDSYNIIFSDNPTQTTQYFTTAILLLHSVAFFFALLGFIYITQTAGHTNTQAWLALCSILLNLVTFSLRATFEFTYIDYRDENYPNG